jgi:hypothetical protein
MHGGWDEGRATKALKQLSGFFDGQLDMTALRG